MSNGFLEFLQSKDAGAILAIALSPITIFMGIGVPLIAQYWYKLRIKQWEMSLKHTMLEKGMSAEEIKAVLAASAMGSEKKHGCWSNRWNA